MSASEANSKLQECRRQQRLSWWLIFYAVLILAYIALIDYAVGAEAEIPGTADALKSLALSGNQWAALLSIALTAITTLFVLLLKSYTRCDADKKVVAAEHAKEIAELQEEHAKERAEWLANTTLLQEQRVALLREVMTGLNNASNHMASTQTSINERTQTAAEISSQLQAQAGLIQALRTSFSDEIAAVQRKLRECIDGQETLASSLRRAS